MERAGERLTELLRQSTVAPRPRVVANVGDRHDALVVGEILDVGRVPHLRFVADKLRHEERRRHRSRGAHQLEERLEDGGVEFVVLFLL